VSQGVTTVVAGNCGVSLARRARHAAAVTPPLDLMDSEGSCFISSRQEYVERCGRSRRPPTARCSSPQHVRLQTMTMSRSPHLLVKYP